MRLVPLMAFILSMGYRPVLRTPAFSVGSRLEDVYNRAKQNPPQQEGDSLFTVQPSCALVWYTRCRAFHAYNNAFRARKYVSHLGGEYTGPKKPPIRRFGVHPQKSVRGITLFQ